jgi:hypothetical protein
MGGIISFLGGSAFRLIWSQIAEYLNKRQDHAQEIERMQVQEALDNNRHKNDCERVRLQSELGVKEIMVAGDIEVGKLEAAAFVEAMKNAVPAPTGIWWVDAWNNIIRPIGATLGYFLVFMELMGVGFVMNDWHRSLVGTMLGFFFASRELAKGRK